MKFIADTYVLSSKGKEFLVKSTTVMSLNPSSTTIDRILASTQDITTQTKKSTQTRGTQVKPRLAKIFETQMWQQGDTDMLKFLGFGNTNSNICLYFPMLRIYQ